MLVGSLLWLFVYVLWFMLVVEAGDVVVGDGVVVGVGMFIACVDVSVVGGDVVVVVVSL